MHHADPTLDSLVARLIAGDAFDAAAIPERQRGHPDVVRLRANGVQFYIDNFGSGN